MDERARIAQWLAGAHPVPRQAEAEWANHGVALLPLGRRFDAVRVPADRIHAAVGSDEAAIVADALLQWLQGPVFRDTRYSEGPYYVLVPPGTAWDGEEHLGEGAYLGVPRVGDATLLAAWVVLPPRPGDLCDPTYLRGLLATAETLREIER
ncbi:hypothetical protein [Streptomyces alboflavus]|uniref:hypothetical protein n=1 Tax=Streptomyces alboflavus TaxID=67267 RepID=UPI00068A9D46|nr:hypothetical protein [Streptomyces alboflavus]